MTAIPKAGQIWGARVRCALLVTVSTVLGFAPVVFFLQRPLWLFAVFGIALVVGIGPLLSKAKRRLPRVLSWREKVALLFASTYESAAIGFVALLTYGSFWVLGKAAVHFHSGLSDVQYLPLFGAAFIGLFGVLGTALNASSSLSELLFPAKGIGSRPLGANFTWARIRNFAFWAAPSGMLLAILGVSHSTLWLAPLQALLAVATIPFFAVLQPEKPKREMALTYSAVKNLFEAAGFQVIERLTTGRVEFDRLIAIFDFVVHRDAYGMAIVVEAGPKGALIKWHDVALIPSALRLIYDAAERSGIELARVTAMIALSGCEPDVSLRTAAPRESIRLFELQDQELIETLVLKKLPQERVAELAHSLLGLSKASVTSSNIGAA